MRRRISLALGLVMALAGCNGGNSAGTGNSGNGDGSSVSGGAAPNVANLSISGIPTTQVEPGQAYSFTPTVSSGQTSLSFNIQNKPTWASFSISTGHLSGTPSTANIGTSSTVVISVSNGATSAALPGFEITVSAAGSASLAWQAPNSNTDGTMLTDLAGYIVSYGTSATALTQSVNIGTASATSYTVDDLSVGTWYFAVTAYTSDGLQSSLSNVVSMTIR